MHRTDRALAGLATAIAMAVVAHAQNVPSRPREYVADLANVVDAGTETRLNGYLQELERKTSAQMLVLTIKTTGGVPIRDFALRTAESWKLGQAGRDNGVLIVVAVDDRQATIETGYGMEPILTDSICGRVEREVFVPSFRRNRYSEGIADGTIILANQVAASAGVTIAGMPVKTVRVSKRPRAPVSCVGLAAILLLSFVFGALGRRRRGYRRWGGYDGGGVLTGLILGQMMGSRHRSWGGSLGGGSWGGGFGGSGGGSFGGGGGGSFGGGGASCGW